MSNRARNGNPAPLTIRPGDIVTCRGQRVRVNTAGKYTFHGDLLEAPAELPGFGSYGQFDLTFSRAQVTEIIEHSRLDQAPKLSGWTWCACCQRCYPTGEARTEGAGQLRLRLCPYQRCSGRLEIDGFKWSVIRTIEPSVTYPKIPMQGMVYPVAETRLYVLVD